MAAPKEVTTTPQASVSDTPAGPPAPAPAPAAPVRRFSFTKNQNPDEVVEVSGGKIKFHRPIRQDGTKASHGTFETKDPTLAAALRELATSRPTLYVFETAVPKE